MACSYGITFAKSKDQRSTERGPSRKTRSTTPTRSHQTIYNLATFVALVDSFRSRYVEALALQNVAFERLANVWHDTPAHVVVSLRARRQWRPLYAWVRKRSSWYVLCFAGSASSGIGLRADGLFAD